jgi:hypothetical protein
MKRIRKPGSPVTKAFLEEMAVKDGSGCWLWPRAVSKQGYGVLRIGKAAGKLWTLHRLAWTVWKGPIPKGISVLHRCDVRRCFNPDHLFLGTQQDNNKDRDSKGRVCHGEKHANAVLTAEQVLEIRRRHKEGERKGDLGDVFGISRQGIHDVVMHRNWKHLP